ncbi:MAG TPA: CHAP domain-containing protein [Rhizomicrobium sp.]|nr:CHAP domain-containing protein [Rhizomicrobium sp.]
MVGSFYRLAVAAAFSAMLAGCSSVPGTLSDDFPDSGSSLDGTTMTMLEKPMQCVPFARAHSGVNIYGDAYTWWDKAGAANYPRTSSPSTGAVMVLAGYSTPEHAHVAVVRRIVSSREIRIDHANWLNNGAIFMDDPVADISPNNDWSRVLVWNVQTHAWGVHTYNVTGFIEPKSRSGSMRVASRDDDLED